MPCPPARLPACLPSLELEGGLKSQAVIFVASWVASHMDMARDRARFHRLTDMVLVVFSAAGYDMAPRPQAFAPSPRSAFSAPSSSSAARQDAATGAADQDGDNKLSVPFIDFLGVGST